MNRRLRVLQPGEPGLSRRLPLRLCQCGHHLLTHSPLNGRCLFWLSCGCRAFREAPPQLEVVR